MPTVYTYAMMLLCGTLLLLSGVGETGQPLYAPAPVVVQHPLLRGLVSWWRVQPPWDGGPTWYDLVGTNHGTLTNMVSAGQGFSNTTRGGGDGEMRFVNASTTYVALGATPPPSLNITGELTVFAWFRPVSASPGGSRVIIGCAPASGADNPYSIFVGRTAQELTVRWADTDILVTSGLALQDGVPHFMTLTRTGSTGAWTPTFYLDGIQKAQNTTSFDPVSCGNAMTIGRRGEATGYFDGALDDIMVWNRALSAAEVAQATTLAQQGWPGVLRRQADVLVQVGTPVTPGPQPRPGSLLPFFWRGKSR